jgi:hypothetical protein
VTTPSAPISTEVGFSHDDHTSPAALPTGTRPDAIPPTAAPRQKGISTEEEANSAPSTRASRIVPACPRSANAAPRKMIPSAARKSGTESVEKIEPNATGNAVQTTTRTKISHTWLASQTGLIACWTIPRTRPPRRAPPAVRSQKPAPKSADPSTA